MRLRRHRLRQDGRLCPAHPGAPPPPLAPRRRDARARPGPRPRAGRPGALHDRQTGPIHRRAGGPGGGRPERGRAGGRAARAARNRRRDAGESFFCFCLGFFLFPAPKLLGRRGDVATKGRRGGGQRVPLPQDPPRPCGWCFGAGCALRAPRPPSVLTLSRRPGGCAPGPPRPLPLPPVFSSAPQPSIRAAMRAALLRYSSRALALCTRATFFVFFF